MVIGSVRIIRIGFTSALSIAKYKGNDQCRYKTINMNTGKNIRKTEATSAVIKMRIKKFI
jgi:hypothetical protein